MSRNSSRLLKAMKGWSTALNSYSNVPKGLFGRKAIITSWAVTIDSDELDFEFEIENDDDLEANEQTVTVYNLSKNTIKNLIVGKSISIKAGYKNDMGIVCSGHISKVKTKRSGVDKVTTIYILDSMGLEEKDLANVTYAKGTKASYILKDLINKTHLPIAAFQPKRDWTYKEEVTINGGLMDSIRKYSEVCGISTWINQGKVYSCTITSKSNGYFNLNVDTGLLDSPEETEETITAEDYEDKITVINAKCLLQHRIIVGSVVKLKSLEYNGEYRVRKCKHIFSPDESYTELELI